MTTPDVPDLRALLRAPAPAPAPAQTPAPTVPAAATPTATAMPTATAVPAAPVTEMPAAPVTEAPAVPGATPAVPAAVPASPEDALSALPATSAPGAFSPEQARKDVPILHRTVNGHPLVWLDNGATTQKPRQVIEALSAYYSAANSNIHRGAHTMAREATELYEAGRTAVAEFLGAESPENITFARGTTEAINLVAQSWGRSVLEPGDEILVPVLEHHSNIVPWQLLAQETHARVVPVPLTPEGEIDQKAYSDLLSARTQLVVISQASNVLGTVPPVREMTALAHRYGARVLVDGAQAVAHMPVDVRQLGADFYVFSGHKLFAPTGIGALYLKPETMELMRPWQGGGNMIESVSFERTTFAPMPHLLEAGTGHISGVVGLLAAIDWLRSFDREAIAAYEHALMTYAMQAMATVPGLEVIGSAAERIAVLTFTLAGHDPASVADWLDRDGIAVRAGHHCAQPALAHYGLESAARASFALYNTSEEVDQLVASLRRLQAGA
ncbi:cysteine desulfurase [Streptomyces sp. NRRL B-1347]|uniref:cysteine desulfurase n=1 Tax=Streptomyces sp. NRRL B-1347 TaxID=1476877 RepID=UPI00055F8102|nr:cysteine desulfurase [Streptomyces sp. NRRL B-1347]